MLYLIIFTIVLAIVAYFVYQNKNQPLCGSCSNPYNDDEDLEILSAQSVDDAIAPPTADGESQATTVEALAGQTFYYAYHRDYSSNPFKFKGWSVDRTNKAIHDSYKEMSSISGANFKPWTGKGAYHIVVNFKTVVGQYNAGGQYPGGKNIEISSGREFKLDAAPWRYRIAHNIIQHETFHLLRYKAADPADGYGHSKDKSCVMNSNATNHFFCPAEVLWMQKRYGKPTVKFRPVDIDLQFDIVLPLRSQIKAEWAAVTKLINERKVWLDQRTSAATKRDAAIVKRNAAEPGPDKIRWRDEARLWHAKILELTPDIKSHTAKITAAQKKALATRNIKEPQEVKLADLVKRWKNIPMTK